MTRIAGVMRLFSKEYFTRNTTPRKRTKPPIQAKSFTPKKASQSIGGRGGLARLVSAARATTGDVAQRLGATGRQWWRKLPGGGGRLQLAQIWPSDWFWSSARLVHAAPIPSDASRARVSARLASSALILRACANARHEWHKQHHHRRRSKTGKERFHELPREPEADELPQRPVGESRNSHGTIEMFREDARPALSPRKSRSRNGRLTRD